MCNYGSGFAKTEELWVKRVLVEVAARKMIAAENAVT
jgi:hypothetical protein